MTEIHLDQGVATENVDEHLQFHVVGIDLGNLTLEVGEWAFFHAHCVANVVIVTAYVGGLDAVFGIFSGWLYKD